MIIIVFVGSLCVMCSVLVMVMLFDLLMRMFFLWVSWCVIVNDLVLFIVMILCGMVGL